MAPTVPVVVYVMVTAPLEESIARGVAGATLVKVCAKVGFIKSIDVYWLPIELILNVPVAAEFVPNTVNPVIEPPVLVNEEGAVAFQTISLLVAEPPVIAFVA